MQSREMNKEIESLYREMFSQLFIYARCNLKNDALAEEAVQDTFQIACTKPQALLESPNPKGWLLLTLKNVLSNTVRSQMKAGRILYEYLGIQGEENAACEDPIRFELLYQDVAETDEYVLLREMVIEGKSHLEMAKERGISVAACRKRVQRAKETLKNIIRKQ